MTTGEPEQVKGEKVPGTIVKSHNECMERNGISACHPGNKRRGKKIPKWEWRREKCNDCRRRPSGKEVGPYSADTIKTGKQG